MKTITTSSNNNLDINTLLDSEAVARSDYETNNNKIPFAGDNLKFLEDAMNGGLISERLYLVGGMPGSGITTLLNNMADNLSLSGQPVLFFSHGVGRAELKFRTLARFSKHNISDFDNIALGSDEICELLKNEPISTIMKSKYIIEDAPDIGSWEEIIEQIEAAHGKGPVIIIDNIRRINTRYEFTDERFRVEYILSKLKKYGRKYHIPIIASSELNRTSYGMNRKKITMVNLKESGALEYEAAWVGVLINDYGHWLVCLKANQGTGVTDELNYKIEKKKMIIIGTMIPCQTVFDFTGNKK